MDIQTREALITEINNFKKEALKMHIVEVLAKTYEHSSLFDHNINADGSVIWFKTQARQLWDFWQAAKAQAVPEGFVLVPERNVHDHYIANHLKGTTCSVDVSELTGNDGDRIYGKLRSFDCLGSDGNTLIYDLESSNFNLVKTTGNTGDFILVPKEPTDKTIAHMTNTPIEVNLLCDHADTFLSEGEACIAYQAMIEAQEQKVTEMKINWGMECPRCNHNEAIIHSTAEKDSGYEFMNGDAVNCLKCGNIGEMDANGEDSDIVWNEDEAQEQSHD